MKTLSLILTTLIGFAVFAVAQTTDTEKQSQEQPNGQVVVQNPVHSFPRIIDDVLVGNGEFLGTERVVEIVTQRFVVHVPGSEGNPGRPEQRTRDLPVGGSLLYRSRSDSFEYRTVGGNLIDHDDAVEQIGTDHVLLVLSTGHVLSDTAKQLFSKNAIVATPKDGG